MNLYTILAGTRRGFDPINIFKNLKKGIYFLRFGHLVIILLIGFLITVMVTGCGEAKKDIIGRWEFGDEEFGGAYEFYEDGVGVFAPSIDPFDPLLVGEFKYTYDPQSGVIILTIEYSPERIKETELHVTFISENEISIEQAGMKKPMQFIRKPLPDLPAKARARIGSMLLGENFELIEAKELSPGWKIEYGDQKVITQAEVDLLVGEGTAWWLVTLQIQGDDQPSLFILQKRDGNWETIQFMDNE